MAFFYLVLLVISAVECGLLPSMENSEEVNMVLPSGNELEETERVTVDLYYEYGCPYCQRMYEDKLLRLVQDLKNYIKLRTYPFGNAKIIEQNGTTTFECQHGPKECYGNMMHACAIDVISGPADDEHSVKEYVTFNRCSMVNGPSIQSIETCAETMRIEAQPIKDCLAGDRAVELMIHYGEETDLVKPRYVPYVIINGELMNSESDLEPSVCAAFKNPPPICQNYLLINQ